jgi:hypothetical protein
VGIELVGAVEGDVDLLHLLKRGERNTELDRQVARPQGGRNPANLQAGSDPDPQSADGPRRRRARAQSDDLAILDEVQTGLCGEVFSWSRSMSVRSALLARRTQGPSRSRPEGQSGLATLVEAVGSDFFLQR